MKTSWLKRIILSLSTMALCATVQAADKTLITYKNGTIKPALATSATKVGTGKYEFALSTGITPDMVKSSLEGKLKKFGAKVSPHGGSAVQITFTGDEDQFLKKVSKTRIQKGGKTALAVESSVSDGGIRAKTAARGPKPDEVKGQVLSVQGDTIKMVVTSAGPATGAKSGAVITVSGRGAFTPKKKDTIFFKKISSSPSWKGAAFTDK